MKTGTLIRWKFALAWIVIVACSPQSFAAEPYLKEFPTVDRVVADFADNDPMEARARQAAALFRLMEIMKEMALASRPFPVTFPINTEKPIYSSYAVMANRLRNAGRATFPRSS